MLKKESRCVGKDSQIVFFGRGVGAPVLLHDEICTECVQNKTLPCALPFRTFAEIHTTSQEIDVRGPGGPWLQK